MLQADTTPIDADPYEADFTAVATYRVCRNADTGDWRVYRVVMVTNGNGERVEMLHYRTAFTHRIQAVDYVNSR